MSPGTPDDELPPPWAKHPEIPAGSIGWRMGYGESYSIAWGRFLSQRPSDRAWRAAYLRRHPLAPRSWARAAAVVLAPGHVMEDDDEPDVDALVAEGLVGDDVAMGAWEAIHGQAPEAPWAASWHGGKLGSAARYGGRELTFWARWCARRREDGQLDAWLRAVPEPAPAWVPMRDAVRDGVVPSRFDPATAWERLSVLVAAHGHAPPPWTLGEAPDALGGERYDDDSSYADAWCLWVYDAFDDGPTWRAYLARHGGVPTPWRAAIDREIGLDG